MNTPYQTLHNHLLFLYGAEETDRCFPRWQQRLKDFQAVFGSGTTAVLERVTEQDAILITYGDMVQQPGQKPMATLAEFLPQHLAGSISTIHLLPFFPYSSDDGFSVINYKQVNPDWGDWGDVATISHSFRLMFDAVVNHISAESDWFQAFLQDERPYTDSFITVDPNIDLSAVFRPRALPLLTAVKTPSGTKQVWTTFSADQVDLNFANPDVLFTVMDVLLFYVAHGAEFIRLDAIAYIWKEIGTDCIHRPQTHEIVRLMRMALDMVAPQVSLITETNVPHEDNIAYFGNGRNEAQLVYNFSLPPLTLHTFHTGNAETLSQWAATLTLPSEQATFFNFLASHDGIGMQPAKGLLSDTAVSTMAKRVKALGGYISYKTDGDGSQSVYELNINYLDALGDPNGVDEPVAWQARRFLTAQAIMLALRGVPGIYFHSLFGSRNWREGVELSGQKRTINRQKLQRHQLEDELSDPTSLRHHVFNGYRQLLKARTTNPAFHPNGAQDVLFCHQAIFALWRVSENGRERVLCLHNVSSQPQQLNLSLKQSANSMIDLIQGDVYAFEAGQLNLILEPYQVLWLQADLD
ncbi:MAG: sugar phosphorylase [Chloroflexi bacterium]|nr:sugar phosphorylase [Chloroflexota bacterium]